MDFPPLAVPETEVHLINPTRDDFVDTIQGVTYTLKSLEGGSFEKSVGDLIATHLKDKIVGEMSGVITDVRIDKVLKDIYL